MTKVRRTSLWTTPPCTCKLGLVRASACGPGVGGPGAPHVGPPGGGSGPVSAPTGSGSRWEARTERWLSASDRIQACLKLGRWGRTGPPAPATPQKHPRVQPTLHLSQGPGPVHRPHFPPLQLPGTW